MIFLTVGVERPFDRLVHAVDRWASTTGHGRHAKRPEIFAQIGRGIYIPQHLAWTRFLDPLSYRAQVQNSDAIIAHAGAGIVLTAIEFERPLLVMPRSAELREARDDHQSSMARRFQRTHGLHVAQEEGELSARLNRLRLLAPMLPAETQASDELIEVLRGFIANGVVQVAQPLESVAPMQPLSTTVLIDGTPELITIEVNEDSAAGMEVAPLGRVGFPPGDTERKAA